MGGGRGLATFPLFLSLADSGSGSGGTTWTRWFSKRKGLSDESEANP
jgi:hypothetical protein